MNIDQLKQRLRAERVYAGSYSLEGGMVENSYSVDLVGDVWVTYFVERGKRYDERLHRTEDEACEFLLSQILSDPTTRIGY